MANRKSDAALSPVIRNEMVLRAQSSDGFVRSHGELFSARSQRKLSGVTIATLMLGQEERARVADVSGAAVPVADDERARANGAALEEARPV